MKPGKYLQEFFSNVLPSEYIRRAAQQHLVKFEKATLKFASTPDEIERVYRDGPESCMKGSESVRLYGAGDFAIAYLQDEDGRITARTVCLPAKKAYIRIYGDYDRLESLLHAEGYEKRTDGDAYDGAKVLADYQDDEFYFDFDAEIEGIRDPHGDGYGYVVAY